MEPISSELDQQKYPESSREKPEYVTILHNNDNGSLLDTPFKRIPIEIITDIFKHCLPQGLNSEKFYNLAEPLFSEPPLLLGRVCRDWRSISQNTPALWSGILISEKYRSLNDIRVDVVKEWLARSGSFPLSIEVTAESIDYRPFDLMSSDDSPIQVFLEEIASHSARWQHVSFNLDVTRFSLSTTTRHRFPELKTLRYSSATNVPLGDNVVDLVTAPKLSECLLTADNLEIKYGSPMSRLQVLEIIDCRNIGDFFDILDYCPFLIKLTLCVTFYTPLVMMPATNYTTRSMTHLRILDFWFSRHSIDSDVFSVWNILYLPALKKFRYAAPQATPRVLQNIYSCLLRSRTDLHEFHLQGFPIGNESFCAILGISPNIKRLMFRCRKSSRTVAIFKALTLDPHLPSALCPQLQALEISSCVSSDYSALIELLLSRSADTLKERKHLLRSRFGAWTQPLNEIYLQRPLRVRQNAAQSFLNDPQKLREKLPRDIRLIHDTGEELWSAPGSEINFSGEQEQVEALSLISTAER